MEEIWKDIPGYEREYQVSDAGRVRSLPRLRVQKSKAGNLHEHKCPGKTLKPRAKECGHLQVQLRGRNRLVHQLVMLAFVGPCPEGMEVCHNDSDPSNNRLANLRYDTRHSRQKLSVDDVRDIRTRLSNGESVSALAKEYSVCYSTIWNIQKKETFKCV